MWQTPRRGDSVFFGECSNVFPEGAEVHLPATGGQGDNWFIHGRLGRVFPRLYALSTDPGVSMQRAGHRAWALALPEALPD